MKSIFDALKMVDSQPESSACGQNLMERKTNMPISEKEELIIS